VASAVSQSPRVNSARARSPSSGGFQPSRSRSSANRSPAAIVRSAMASRALFKANAEPQ
jgi:hypothetical protein